VWDLGGREMIDVAMGGGSMILGHSHPAVVEAIGRQARGGTIYTVPHAAVHGMDELLDQFIPWLRGRVWCNSGSEAIMRLCRIARAVTGKDKIAIFSGCWHGSWDGTLVEEDYDVSGGIDCAWPAMKLLSPGILGQIKNSLLMLPYRNVDAMERIRERKDEIACVLIEPVQGSNPSDEVEPFLRQLRAVCDQTHTLLAFDEVVTGFRLAHGGGQEYFSVHADLAAYGKILGGGLPVGMVAGKSVIMNEARDRKAFFGGTFSANPMTIAAGMATLSLLGHQLYDSINGLGRQLRNEVNMNATQFGLPLQMMQCGSILRPVLSRALVTSRRQRDKVEPDLATRCAYYELVRRQGIHVGANRLHFLSTSHTAEKVREISQALCVSAVVARMNRGED
jgi:glutamate-1-semialdehyde 2,1-aminomutase